MLLEPSYPAARRRHAPESPCAVFAGCNADSQCALSSERVNAMRMFVLEIEEISRIMVRPPLEVKVVSSRTLRKRPVVRKG
jgi:hypothetical protein